MVTAPKYIPGAGTPPERTAFTVADAPGAKVMLAASSVTRVLVADAASTTASARLTLDEPVLVTWSGVVIGVAVTRPKESVGGLTVMGEATAAPASSLPPPSDGTPAGFPVSSTETSCEAVFTKADLICAAVNCG